MQTPHCHRYLIGLESAEAQAKRERSLGRGVGVLDPGVEPNEYHWRVADEDVLAHCTEDVSQDYLHSLAVTLLSAEARIIVIFDSDGHCIFGRFPGVVREAHAS